jgi:hypothetical protein
MKYKILIGMAYFAGGLVGIIGVCMEWEDISRISFLAPLLVITGCLAYSTVGVVRVIRALTGRGK